MREKTEEQQIFHAEMLADVKNILESHGVTAILSGATLLGLHRDGDMVPWCRGAVLITFIDQIKKKENEIILDLKKAGFFIDKHWKNFNYKIKVSKSEKLDNAKIIVEVVGFHKNKEYFVRRLRNKLKVIPIKLLEPPYAEKTLRGEKYKTPKDIEGFLSFVYKDWKTPTKSKIPSKYKRSEHIVITNDE